MRDYAIMSRTVWSGIMNYMKASAQNAEAIKPWSFREEKAALTILVFSTSIQGLKEQSLVFDQLNQLLGENNWTIDLDDVDKVLRVVSTPGNQQKIINILNLYRFSCEVMGFT